jgi:hypothetical protein
MNDINTAIFFVINKLVGRSRFLDNFGRAGAEWLIIAMGAWYGGAVLVARMPETARGYLAFSIFISRLVCNVADQFRCCILSSRITSVCYISAYQNFIYTTDGLEIVSIGSCRICVYYRFFLRIYLTCLDLGRSFQWRFGCVGAEFLLVFIIRLILSAALRSRYLLV